MYIIFCAILALMSTEAKPYYPEENAQQIFEEFILNYNRTYLNEIEKIKRFQIFIENLKEINHLNSLDDAEFGINDFSDISDEEFKKYMGLAERDGGILNYCTILTDNDVTSFSAPPSLDYRNNNAVTDVKSQGACGSCWLFSSVGSIESNYALKYGRLLRLSEQQLLDCLQCSRPNSCDTGGIAIEALSELTALPGVMAEYEYQYEEYKTECRYNPFRAQVRVAGCYNYNLRNEDMLKEVLYRHGPIAITINGAAASKYHQGILGVHCCLNYIPKNAGHSVLLVGYGTDVKGRDYWLIKNSWGPKFGENGYMRISRGFNTCGLMNPNAVSAIIA